MIIAIGNYVQESIITTLNLKEAGVSYVIAKASSEIHVSCCGVLELIALYFPEYEAAVSWPVP